MTDCINVQALIEALDRETLIIERATAFVRKIAEEQHETARKLERARFRIIEGGRK